jgi:hypothetical protein
VSTHFAFTHEFSATPEKFWRVFLHEPYNIELYDRIGVKERTVLDRSEDAGTIRWSVRIVPKRDLPAIIKKVVGGDLGYTEHGTYHKGQDRLDVRIETTLMRDRTRIGGLYSVTPLGAGRLRRTFEGDVHVDVALVGRKVEAVVVDDMRRSYDVAAQVTAEWLAQNKIDGGA